MKKNKDEISEEIEYDWPWWTHILSIKVKKLTSSSIQKAENVIHIPHQVLSMQKKEFTEV